MEPAPKQRELAVTRQLVAQLYQNGPVAQLGSAGLAVVTWFLIKDFLSPAGISAWLLVAIVASLFRVALILRWRALQEQGSETAWRLTALFTAGAIASGMVWGALVLFLDAGTPELVKLFLLVLLVAMPLAALPADAVYLPAYWGFSLPILLMLTFWSLAKAEAFTLSFLFMLLAYGTVLWFTVKNYNGNLRESLEMRIDNQVLVSKLSHANKELKKMAYFDPLTGLANRRWFQEEIDRALARLERQPGWLALMLIDLDGFKQVNDRYGHDMGDRMLSEVGARLRRSLRLGDLVGRAPSEAVRMGGDEFTVLLEGGGASADLSQAAKRVLEQVGRPMVAGDLSLPVRLIGLTLTTEASRGSSGLLREADLAMYRAKRSGGNCWVMFEASGEGTDVLEDASA